MQQIRCVLPDVNIYSLFRSSKNELWIGTWQQGLYRITAGGNMIKEPYTHGTSQGISSKHIRELTEDNQGNIWFGTFEGLHKYDASTGRYTLYSSDRTFGSLSHSSVFAVYRDNQGTIWAGTYFGGVNYFNPEKDLFQFYPYGNEESGRLSFPVVGNMVEDKDGNLWICTEGGGLNCLDRKNGTVRVYKASSAPGSLLHNNLKTICYDNKRHCLYIGTHTGGLTRFDIRTQTFKNYLERYKGKNDVPGDIINKVAFYNDNLIVAARNGSFLMNPDTEIFQPLIEGVSCLTFDVDKDGYLWMSYGEELVRLNLNDWQDRKVFNLGQYGVSIAHIFVAGNGYVYLGSYGSGLFQIDRQSGTTTRFTVATDKLLSDYCYTIAETPSNRLLVTTDKGIMLFSPSDKSLNVIRLRMGIPLASIVADCGTYVCRDREIFVGGTNGLASFREEEIDAYTASYTMYFEELFVDNKQVYPGDETGILDVSLPFTNRIELSYKQNNLSFKFSVSDYINFLKSNQYEYKLEGFDKEWITTDNPLLYYTNLNPGSYILKVREPGLYTKGVPKEISLLVVIRSPWYNTVWAWMAYLLSVGLLLYWGWQAKKTQLELALSLREERNEKERIEKLNQAKLRFFTNISHEFRTPLTLILSHLDILLQNNSFHPLAYNKLKKVYKHAYRMRNLITELLDFRKLEQQQITLHVAERDIVLFLKDIFLSFSDYAAQHGISYHFQSETAKIMAWFDDCQMQKVFYNLLSNAFKHTPEGQYIEFTVSEDADHVFIKVVDGGIGLSATDKENVFDCFFQAAHGETEAANPGTGIGLALTKSIVMLHEGHITVESQVGYGSIFTVALQKGKQHFQDREHIVISEKQDEPTVRATTLPESGFDELYDRQPEIFPDSSQAGLPPDAVLPVSRYTLLLVEDNEELMQVLVTLFSPFYTIIQAFNGEDGLEKATNECPDLIVSDVMMPLMSGTEMCLSIKRNINLCHIPVILLSAFNSDEQSVEGLRCGADDFVGKPFHAKQLLLRCNNQIRNRINLQHKLQHGLQHDVPRNQAGQENLDVSLLATNPLDKEFLNWVVHLIDGHLEEADFDVNCLAREMALSRSSFFSKFKALTGVTPAGFIQDYKLIKAAELLVDQPFMQISGISDKLGFNTPHYFGRCFKAKYGVSPVEYRKDRQPAAGKDS